MTACKVGGGMTGTGNLQNMMDYRDGRGVSEAARGKGKDAPGLCLWILGLCCRHCPC